MGRKYTWASPLKFHQVSHRSFKSPSCQIAYSSIHQIQRKPPFPVQCFSGEHPGKTRTISSSALNSPPSESSHTTFHTSADSIALNSKQELAHHPIQIVTRDFLILLLLVPNSNDASHLITSLHGLVFFGALRILAEINSRNCVENYERLYAFDYHPKLPFNHDGWSHFDCMLEYSRMGVGVATDQWRISSANRSFSVCIGNVNSAMLIYVALRHLSTHNYRPHSHHRQYPNVRFQAQKPRQNTSLVISS